MSNYWRDEHSMYDPTSVNNNSFSFFQEENLFSVAAIIFRRAMVTQECFFLIGFQLYCLLQVCLLHAELSMRMQMLLRSAIGGKWKAVRDEWQCSVIVSLRERCACVIRSSRFIFCLYKSESTKWQRGELLNAPLGPSWILHSSRPVFHFRNLQLRISSSEFCATRVSVLGQVKVLQLDQCP